MNKKILIGAIIFILAGVGIYFLNIKIYQSAQVEVRDIPIPTPTLEFTKWDDPAQFTFEYPKEATVDAHPENKNDYAQVELKSESHPGGITIWSKDTTASSIDDFIKQNKIDGALDTTLGGIPGKKYYENADKSVLSIASIQFGNLYIVQTSLKDSPYWQKVSDNLISSFQFKELPTSAATQSSQPDNSSDSSDSGGDEVIE